MDVQEINIINIFKGFILPSLRKMSCIGLEPAKPQHKQTTAPTKQNTQ